MKPYSVRIFSFVSLVLFLFACQKHINDVLLPTPVPEPGPKDSLSLSAETVITNLHGKVLDDAGSPLKDAVVSAGGTTTSTDEYGIFSLRNVTVSKQFGYISVKKNGFFDGSRTVLTNPTTGNFVEIQLIKKDLKGSFNAAEQASLQIDPNTTINFQQQAIVDENGQVYNGIVKVYGAVINPSDNNFSRTMPGDLRGLRNDSTVTALISYGMITVNLEGESGQKLQLAPT